MIGNLALKTAPAVEPVTVAEQKMHMRVDIDDDDTYIGVIITAARKNIEKLYGVRMVTQTWYYYLDAFPLSDVIDLPIGPVTSITSVKYTPAGESQETFSSSTGYETDTVSLPARIVLKDGQSWPSDTLNRVHGVCIEFETGYLASSTLTTAKAAQAAAEALVAAAETEEEIAAAKIALAAAAAGVTAAETAEITAIPEDLKNAVKLLAAHFYENREASTTLNIKVLPMAVESLLSGYRMWQRQT